MKRFLTKVCFSQLLIGSLFFLNISFSNVFSQTVVWSEGFEGLSTACGSAAGSTLVTTSCTPTNWLTSRNFPWIASSTAFRTGTRCIKMTNNWTGWLITAGANLNANVTYNLTFYYKGVCSSSCSAGMNVKVGVTTTQTTAPATTTTVVNNGQQTNYTQFTYSYTPNVSGVYYFGLQMSSTIAGFDNGYIDDMQLSFNCSAPTTPIFTAGATNICEGAVSTYQATSTGTIAYSILTGGATIDAVSGTVSNVASDYTVRATANTGCGITTADRLVTVNSNPIAPVVSATGSLTFCEGQSVVLNSSYPSGNLWSNNQLGETLTVNTTGNYSLIYTDLNGCSSTSNAISVQVNPTPTPIISAQGPSAFCEGGSVILNSSASNGNLWSTNQIDNSITVNQTGDFSLVVTDINGCTGSSNTISVVAYPLSAIPTINVSGSLVFCEGEQVALYTSVNDGIMWSTTETTNSIIATTTGTYFYNYTDANGCTTTSLPVEIEVISSPAIPVISVQGNTSICEGNAVTLISPQNFGNVWSTNETSENIIVTEAGNYILTITNSNGCSATSEAVSISVNANPSPIITASGATTFCEGSSVQLSSSESTGNLWSNGNQTATIIASLSGDYSVTFTDANGCTGTSNNISLVVNPLPTTPSISANGPLTICAGTSVLLTSSENGGNAWSNQETTNVISVNIAGSFTVTNTSANGCSATSAPTVVTVNPVPVALASLTSDNVISANPAGQSYQWIDCAENQNINGATAINFTATSNGSYAVILTNTFGCRDTSNCVTVDKVSLEENSALLDVSIFPNPAEETISIALASNTDSFFDLTVYDAAGKIVLIKTQLHSPQVVAIDNLNPGVYLMQIQSQKQQRIFRIIKK